MDVLLKKHKSWTAVLLRLLDNFRYSQTDIFLINWCLFCSKRASSEKRSNSARCTVSLSNRTFHFPNPSICCLCVNSHNGWKTWIRIGFHGFGWQKYKNVFSLTFLEPPLKFPRVKTCSSCICGLQKRHRRVVIGKSKIWRVSKIKVLKKLRTAPRKFNCKS